MRVFVLNVIWILLLSLEFSESARKYPPSWGRYGKHGKHNKKQQLSQDDSAEDINCEPPWEQLHRSCIQFIKDEPFLTWQEAREECQRRNADLLCVNNLKEKNKLYKFLKKHITSVDLLHWWLGLRQVDVNGTWLWVDNAQLNTNLISWAPNHDVALDDYGELIIDHCAVLEYQGYLKRQSCNDSYPFICEQVTVTPSPSPTTPTTTTTTTVPTTREERTRPTVPTRQTGPPNTTNRTQPTNRPTDRPNGTTHPPTDSGTKSTPSSTTTEDKTKRTKRPTEEPVTTQQPTYATGRPTGRPTDRPTPDPRQQEALKFQGCYAVNYESTCPPVEAFGIQWPRTAAGKMASVPCDGGKTARWKCDKNPTCWREEPDVKQCTSEAIQDLTNQLEDLLEDPGNSEKTEAFTENLATTSTSDTVMSEQDIYQSTKLMEAAASTKPKNSTVAKNIIKNVAKCGSGLVSNNRKNTWASMKKENQRTVASSLLSSMETVTIEMMKSFDEPTIEKIEEENIVIELQVVDITDTTHSKKVSFDSGTTNFDIPKESLLSNSPDNLVRLVFISYDSIGALLDPHDDAGDDADTVISDTDDDGSTRKLVSKVVSASMGEKKVEDQPLKKPITYTMYTGDLTPKNKQLCSFWNFSLEYTGAWSQKGCSFKSYNATHTTCQCEHLTNFAILMDIHSTKMDPIHATTLTYVTYVGIIISIICLFLSWITFICLSIRCMRRSHGSSGMDYVHDHYGHSAGSSASTASTRSAQGERNSIHKNLVFCLFVAEVLFLAGIERTDHRIACAIIAGFLHYFFLASFSWMFVEGIHILFMLVQVFDAAKSRLKYYYCIGYGAPLFIVGISALVYHDGYGTQRFCWLTTERMFIWSFAGPVAFILLVNLMILIYAMSAVCKHSEYVFAKEKSATGNMKAWIQGALAIEVLLGLTWVFGYFYISEEAIPLAYLFTIFNSLQGLFIFIFHCIMNKKVRKEYERFIDYPKRPVTSATNTSKGSHQNGSGPHTASYNMSSRKQSGPFLDLSNDRRQSTKSTTSA